MPCYYPIHGWRGRTRNPLTGRRPVVFSLSEGVQDQKVTVPCGRCIGCRIDRSRQWAVRCMHEASLYEKNCFITLTYNDEHLPKNGSLKMEDLQKFWKRLRKEFGKGIKYYACGEYGDINERPHYHACIFNLDFNDKYLWSTSNGINLYRSEILEKIWSDEKKIGIGNCIIGDVTFESAAYVARYVFKKWLGKDSEKHPVNWETGEIYENKDAEFTVMSRREAIGKAWFLENKNEVKDFESVYYKGKMVPVPKQYGNIWEKIDVESWEQWRVHKRKKAIALQEKITYHNLIAGEAIKKQKTKQLIRSI